MNYLMIVESPHKAETIQRFLGGDYKVVSSKGHIRDLKENGLSVDIEHGFAPEYVIPEEKKKTVAELQKLSSKADIVYLASDEDREGEAISWHLTQALSLDGAATKRITFHEITKSAILEALKNPREIDMNLVNAQQARRVLDRLVGYELSPVLWRKIRRGLSAGRVQSVALRLVTDREKQILAFKAEPYYRTDAVFSAGGSSFKGTLGVRFKTEEQAREFLQDSIGAVYTVEKVERREGSRTPAPPFTTSTLQQEAGKKLGLPVRETMRLAQSLYERGLITYMRTDSTNLSSLALGTAKKFITDNFGAQYSKPRQYHTHSKGAQEAHEAIRPTYIANTSIEGTVAEQKLYSLIWKRTVASQMADARVTNTTVSIALDTRVEKYSVQAVEILFDGFMKLYSESRDDDSPAEQTEEVIPSLVVGQSVDAEKVDSTCHFTSAPARYSEPTLVKKLEELGIGRPSTYAPTISTLTTERGYIVKGNSQGQKYKVNNLSLRGSLIRESVKEESVGAEKGRLLPTEIGMEVSDYLVENFADVMDYGFTASVETSFDKIAEGQEQWQDCISDFYTPFHREVEQAISEKTYHKIERVIGTDPADGKTITAKMGPYGPYVQKGEGDNRVIARLGRDQLIESLTLEQAVKLFALPRSVGSYKDAEIIVTTGRYGPYLKYDGKNYKLPRGANPLSVNLQDCISAIEGALESKTGKVLRTFDDGRISLINGKYGPYIKCEGHNYKIPAGVDAGNLSEEQAKNIVTQTKPTSRRRGHFTKKKQ